MRTSTDTVQRTESAAATCCSAERRLPPPVRRRRRLASHQAQAQRRRRQRRAGGQQAEHPRDLRRRYRRPEYQRLHAWRDGLPTPNIDRIAKEGMMFTDSTAQQSCTAGRASFILGQSRSAPACQGRHAGRPHGISRVDADHRRAAQDRRATRPASSARTISATATSTCRPYTASTSSSAISTTSTPRRSRRATSIRKIPEFKKKFGPRGVHQD